MSLSALAHKLILKPEFIHEVRHKNGTTIDIMNTILYADQFIKPDTAKFAKKLKGVTTEQTLRNVWNFVKKEITYIADKKGFELVKSPSLTAYDRYGDCKSMSLLIASLLTNLEIPFKYRFVSYSKSKRITHVYIVAEWKGREYILDAVNTAFDKEASYKSKEDRMTEISYLRGIEDRVQSQVKEPVTIPRSRKIDFTGSTDGQIRLLLIDRQLEILSAVHPEKKAI